MFLNKNKNKEHEIKFQFGSELYIILKFYDILFFSSPKLTEIICVDHLQQYPDTEYGLFSLFLDELIKMATTYNNVQLSSLEQSEADVFSPLIDKKLELTLTSLNDCVLLNFKNGKYSGSLRNVEVKKNNTQQKNQYVGATNYDILTN